MWNEFSLARLGEAFLLSFLVAWAAWRAKTLSLSGAVAAFVMGGIVFGVGGWGAAAVLLTFFVTSSLLSRAFAQRKESLTSIVLKGSQRDAAQVLANGGFGALCLLAGLLSPPWSLPFLAFCGSLAAANADTWATELGVLSPQPPRLLTNGKIVPRGASGGVTGWGLLASLLGALLIGGVAAFFVEQAGWALVAVSLGGLLGSLLDSILGASLQAVYFCPRCQKETERHPFHSCGEATVFQRGLTWLNNDWVNFACTVLGGVVAGAMGWFFLG
ncbi:MAG: DUF92 domain-containing protein [Anaerolineae bacterium]|jgi:uncharacterized protein (TIGR00297 family)|nr:MAG: DUF92 domain-containing protein [Anaerolineae bacterium]